MFWRKYNAVIFLFADTSTLTLQYPLMPTTARLRYYLSRWRPKQDSYIKIRSESLHPVRLCASILQKFIFIKSGVQLCEQLVSQQAPLMVMFRQVVWLRLRLELNIEIDLRYETGRKPRPSVLKHFARTSITPADLLFSPQYVNVMNYFEETGFP